jgi:hypothetical protein
MTFHQLSTRRALETESTQRDTKCGAVFAFMQIVSKGFCCAYAHSNMPGGLGPQVWFATDAALSISYCELKASSMALNEQCTCHTKEIQQTGTGVSPRAERAAVKLTLFCRNTQTLQRSRWAGNTVCCWHMCCQTMRWADRGNASTESPTTATLAQHSESRLHCSRAERSACCRRSCLTGCNIRLRSRLSPGACKVPCQW